MKGRALTWFMVVLLALALLAAVGRRVHQEMTKSGDAARRARSAVVAVETAPVRRGEIRLIGELTGTLTPESQFTVAPKVAGRLEKLPVNIGDRVRKGDLIAEIESAEYEQQVAQALAELEVAKANVIEAKSALDVTLRELERVRELRREKVASEAQLDEAESRFKAAEAKHQVSLAQVRQREAALETARVRLSYTQMRAAWSDGDAPRFVAERFVDEGAMLRANDPVVSIVSLDRMTAVVYVIERDYPRIRIGQEATLTTDAFPGQEFQGEVLRVAPLLKESSRQARVEIAVRNPDLLLKPGMFVRARIELARRENAVLVPFAALVRRDGKSGVFLVEQAAESSAEGGAATPNAGGAPPRPAFKARFVPVTVGIIQGETAEIVEPAVVGQVVTLGHHLLEDGSSVVLPDAAPAAGEGARGSRPGRKGAP